MAPIDANVRARATDIKLLVLDVDGILTDGRLYFAANGDELKSFHVRDGSGIVQALRRGIQIAVISGRSSMAVTRRMGELGVQHVFQGIEQKQLALQQLLSDMRIAPNALACMGDDAADIPIMKQARLAISVPDAHASAKQCAHYITQANGGHGAVREVCDLLIEVRQGEPA